MSISNKLVDAGMSSSRRASSDVQLQKIINFIEKNGVPEDFDGQNAIVLRILLDNYFKLLMMEE